MTDLLSEMQHVDTIVNNCCVLSKLYYPEQATVLIANELFTVTTHRKFKCPGYVVLLDASVTTATPKYTISFYSKRFRE